MAKYDQTNSVIGEGSIFEGRFYISGSLRVDGKFEGDIRTDEALVVGETGKVKTNISAREVILAGTLIGDIDANVAKATMEQVTQAKQIVANMLATSMGKQKIIFTSVLQNLSSASTANITNLAPNARGRAASPKSTSTRSPTQPQHAGTVAAPKTPTTSTSRTSRTPQHAGSATSPTRTTTIATTTPQNAGATATPVDPALTAVPAERKLARFTKDAARARN